MSLFANSFTIGVLPFVLSLMLSISIFCMFRSKRQNQDDIKWPAESLVVACVLFAAVYVPAVTLQFLHFVDKPHSSGDLILVSETARSNSLLLQLLNVKSFESATIVSVRNALVFQLGTILTGLAYVWCIVGIKRVISHLTWVFLWMLVGLFFFFSRT